jgi:hypothetical protein
MCVLAVVYPLYRPGMPSVASSLRTVEERLLALDSVCSRVLATLSGYRRVVTAVKVPAPYSINFCLSWKKSARESVVGGAHDASRDTSHQVCP